MPTTEALLTSHDVNSGTPFPDLVTSDEFLASHILCAPVDVVTPGRSGPILREVRGRPKHYHTYNGRVVFIKDSYVYTSKGFRIFAQAQLLHDAMWYTDTVDPKEWLLYYISKPLVGTAEEIKINPAVFVSPTPNSESEDSITRAGPVSPLKNIKSFHELISSFPLIAKHMKPGLEKIFSEFSLALEQSLPPLLSATSISYPESDRSCTSAIKTARSSSKDNSHAIPLASSYENSSQLFDFEDKMRVSLEKAVMAAIDIFQTVEKQQLLYLGTTTDLTGPAVERHIECYVTENVHSMVFPRLMTIHRQKDLDLEANIRHLEYIDISQLGVSIPGGPRGKHNLTLGLGKAVEEFRKINTALGPCDMIDVLLSTVKSVAELTNSIKWGTNTEIPTKKPLLTVNADTLVSFLLYVIIRANVRYLYTRLSYLRNFAFIIDVDHGEMGYAISTYEAVLSYLMSGSESLCRVSRQNKILWDAAVSGAIPVLQGIMELSPSVNDVGECDEDEPTEIDQSLIKFESTSLSISSRPKRCLKRSSLRLSLSERFSQGSNLSHVFFHDHESYEKPVSEGILFDHKRRKRVAVETRSVSNGSELSLNSKRTSIMPIRRIAKEADTSLEELAHICNSRGESIPMMAIQHKQIDSLKYLLSLSKFYPLGFILEDCNHEETTLLSATVQLESPDLINLILELILSLASPEQIIRYLALQDVWGRSVAHYLFHAPFLISHIGSLISWCQRDNNGQTPLFALCRSYDHADYHWMVETGLVVAQAAQGDGQPLHLDQHVDKKGNTILHIINGVGLAQKILMSCDVDVNATNDKNFTPLMVASKYGRLEMVKALFGDPRVDVAARELRGLTAVELAKDDDVRNQIDDLTLFLMPPGKDGRITGVVRSCFVEDATIRLVIKSGVPANTTSYTVTTSRRSLVDFEHLCGLLQMENPASWIPDISRQRSPFQVPSRPSRAALKVIQVQLDWFLKILLLHPTFSTHEMLWEFFLAPEIQPEMMEQRSTLKARARAEKVREELEPVEDVREVEQFIDHAHDMTREVLHATKSVCRRINMTVVAATDMQDAATLFSRATSTMIFLPRGHTLALEIYAQNLISTQSHPYVIFHCTFKALLSAIEALLLALTRSSGLITQMKATERIIERTYNSLSRSSRWHFSFLDETVHRLDEEKRQRARISQIEDLRKELRHSQTVVASELAGWQDMHKIIGRRAIVELARGMLTTERVRLDGLKGALRNLGKNTRGAL